LGKREEKKERRGKKKGGGSMDFWTPMQWFYNSGASLKSWTEEETEREGGERDQASLLT